MELPAAKVAGSLHTFWRFYGTVIKIRLLF